MAFDHSLSHARVMKIIETNYPETDSNLRLNQYIDCGYFIEVDDKIELLYPYYLMLIKRDDDTRVNRYEQMALEGILTGWVPKSNAGPKPSPGHAAEKIVLEQIVRCSYFSNWSDQYGLLAYDVSTQVIENDAVIDPNNVHNMLLQDVSNFVGLDGFVFQVTDALAMKVNLYVLQIKTGRLDLRIDRSDL